MKEERFPPKASEINILKVIKSFSTNIFKNQEAHNSMLSKKPVARPVLTSRTRQLSYILRDCFFEYFFDFINILFSFENSLPLLLLMPSLLVL